MALTLNPICLRTDLKGLFLHSEGACIIVRFEFFAIFVNSVNKVDVCSVALRHVVILCLSVV
jgi:hypothetical protein